MKYWVWIGVLFWMVGCATAPPVKQGDVDNAMGEARMINNKYGAGCQSLGWPKGSISYINCLLNFYQQEKPDVEDRREVLVEALKQATQKK
jgi:hypothetical protein